MPSTRCARLQNGTAIDLDALERDRDQLWAEARDRFRRHEPWWLDTRELDALAAEQQVERYQRDAWDEPIRVYLHHEMEWMENGYCEQRQFRPPRVEPLDDVSVAEVLEQALRIERGRWSQADQNRLRCLVSMGFMQYRTNRDHGRERRYRRARLESGPGGPGRG